MKCKATFVDVGNGDSIVIKCSRGEIIVVDSNQPGFQGRKSRNRTLELLKKEFEGRKPVIDCLCVTHPDKDHYSGIVDILDWIYPPSRPAIGRIKTLVIYGHDLELFEEELVKARDRAGGDLPPLAVDQWNSLHTFARKVRAVEGRIRRDGGAVVCATDYRDLAVFRGGETLEIVAPDQETWREIDRRVYKRAARLLFGGKGKMSGRWNDMSVVLWFRSGRSSVLLTGDSRPEVIAAGFNERARTRKRLNLRDRRKWPVKSNVIKVPHHGSRLNSSRNFWTQGMKARNGYAVITANGTSHPHAEVVKQIAAARPKAKILATRLSAGLAKMYAPRVWIKNARSDLQLSGRQRGIMKNGDILLAFDSEERFRPE